MTAMTKEDIDTAEIRRAANARQPHNFPKGVMGGRCRACGSRGMEAVGGCRPVETVTFSAEIAKIIADEIDRLRAEVAAMEAELKQHVR